jgi:vacuolar-type H+-ATPase subunit C/Vma6
MFRRTEIENVLTGFTASIMNLISQYRQKRDAENQVPFFVNAVEGERARMANKFESLRGDAGLAPLAGLIDSVEREVNALADSEIARAQASGTVEFDTLTSALRDTASGLNNVAGKLEGKENG